MKSKNQLTKVDAQMLDAADKIFKNLNDGICTNLYAADINDEGTNLTTRLADKGYINIISNPKRKGHAYEWLQGDLRPYQVFMMQQAVKAKDNLVIAALPTGTGKTKLALALIQQYKRTLFVTPRINLSAATHSIFGESLDVGLMQGSNTKNLEAPHIVANLQTLERRVDDLPQFDLIVWDEIHYSFERIQKLIERLPAKHVGLTATSYYADGTPLPARIIEPFDTHYFIKRGYLAKLKCMQTVLVDDSKLKKSSTGDFTEKSINEVTKDDVFNRNIIDSTKDAIQGQALVFAANIAHCEKLAAGYSEAGFQVLTMHSNMKKPLEALEAFKAKEAQLLVTVNQVSFGTDVPAVETGIIARPIGSKSLWRQITGRLLRIAPNKDGALLLDCGGNLKRLGNPLTKAKPPQERELKSQAKCAECDYQKAPYLKAFNQSFNIVTRLYCCASCGFEHEAELEIDTVACEECQQYHLTTDLIIQDDKEVLKCGCGHVSIINQLDDLALVLEDDALISLKIKAAIDKAGDEVSLLETAQAATAILGAINDDLNKSHLLLMLENMGLIETARIIQQRDKVAEQQKQQQYDNQLIAKVKADIEAENTKAKAKADSSTKRQKAKQQNDSGILGLINNANNRYKQKGLSTLTGQQISKFMRGYDACVLSHKQYAVKTRISNIENKEQPINYLMTFIDYIETHQTA